VNDTAKAYSRRNNVWKKVKWASTDEAGLRLLLKDIKYFNKRLESLLHPVDQIHYEKDSNAVMRSIVTRSSDRTLLDNLSGTLDTVDPAIAASAHLKQKAFLLELLSPTQGSRGPQGSPSGSATPTGHEKLAFPTSTPVYRQKIPTRGLNNSHLQKDPNRLMLKTMSHSLQSREIASYEDATIIVEWKIIDGSFESKLKYRVANVAAFLAEMDDLAFHSLTCCGYLKEPKSGRYAYLFKPSIVDAESVGVSNIQFAMKSLEDLFALKTLLPSLNQRVSIAIALAETVLQLHTAGWLHKSIRPDNVLFFKASLEDWNLSYSIPPAYLSGYEYARADNPLETSEDPSLRRYADLYRHPLSIGRGRASYNQRFDLYSLGCILLELGFWVPLRTILLQCMRSESSESQLKIRSGMIVSPLHDTEYYQMVSERQRLLQDSGYGRLERELEFRMGLEYARVVRNCLTAGMTATGGLGEDFEHSIEVQEGTLATLKQLLAVV
jgi:Prion-inhibition and propagation